MKSLSLKHALGLGLLLCAVFLSVAPVSFAQQTEGGGVPAAGSSEGGNTSSKSTFAITNPLNADSIGEVVLSFITIFSYVVILLGVLCLIYVGFRYVLASAEGDKGKLAELHGYLLYIVIGIAIVIGARVIVQVVINTLAASGTINQGVINSAGKILQK